MLTYRLFKTQNMLLLATESASQMLTYNLFKKKSMLLSAIGRKGKLDGDSQSIQNPEHALVSYKQGEQIKC